MSEQLDLQLSRTAPVVDQREIDALCSFLQGRTWTTASVIELELGLDERRIRAIAEQSDGMILSGPGCPGYKLLSSAAQLREVDEAAGRLESQAKRMLARALSMRRRAHKLLSIHE